MATLPLPVWNQKWFVFTDCSNNNTYKVNYEAIIFDTIVGSSSTIKIDLTGNGIGCYTITMGNGSGFGTPPPLLLDYVLDWNDETYEITNLNCIDCLKSFKTYILEDCDNTIYYLNGSIYDLESYLNQSINITYVQSDVTFTKCLSVLASVNTNEPGLYASYNIINGVTQINSVNCLCDASNNCGIEAHFIGVDNSTYTTELNKTDLFNGRPVYQSLKNGILESYFWYKYTSPSDHGWVCSENDPYSVGDIYFYKPSDSYTIPLNDWIIDGLPVIALGLRFLFETQCCFELTDCKTGEVYQTQDDLSQYVGQVITLGGQFFGRCFSISQGTDCTSPISIASRAISSYSNCDTCNNIFGYKLVSCENPSVFIYTINDLSQYIGKTVTLEQYGETCFYVSTLDIVPPSGDRLDIVVNTSFEDCQDCKLKRYKIVNCQDPLDFIITDTDLELYLGKVIKIKGCPDKCFTVESSNDTVSNTDVLLDLVYDTCLECNPPVQVEPRKATSRFVEPNYNINYCSTDEFENTSCSFADNVYKDMIENKYGIKHCCKDDYHKSYIKYQMMMYQIKTIPNIICTEVSDNNCNCS